MSIIFGWVFLGPSPHTQLDNQSSDDIKLKETRTHPTQRRFNAGTVDKIRLTASGAEAAPASSALIHTIAVEKACSASFPSECSNTQALGEYGLYYKEILARFYEAKAQWKVMNNPHYDPELNKPKAVDSRDFIARAAYDSKQIRSLLEVCLHPARSGCPQWGPWEEPLLRCLKYLPDLNYFGFVPLPEEKFALHWNNDHALFLHHMFEKHHGELIVVDRRVGDPVPLPSSPNCELLVHPQFFALQTHTHKNARRLAQRHIGKSAVSDDEFSSDILKHLLRLEHAAHSPTSASRPLMCNL